MLVRLILFGSLLIAAWPALAQDAPSTGAPAQAAPGQEAPSEEPVPSPPEDAPPLVQAPGSEQAAPPLDSSPPSSISLRRGEQLRVETGAGQSHSGELVSLTPGALSLQADPEQVLNVVLADVQRLEVRKRAVVPGMVTGGVIGAVSGGVFMGLICAYAIETDPNPAPCVAFGGLIGAALGVGAGAIMGLAVPRWSTIYEKEKHGRLVLTLTEPEADVLADWFSGAGLLGELGLQLGYARDMRTAESTDRLGGRLHVLALIGPHFAVGPEVAWYGKLSDRTSETSLFQLGALARLGTGIGPVRASVLGGLGLMEKGSGHLEASVGGELEVRLGGLVPLALDARYHFDIEDKVTPSDSLTVGVGTRVRW